MKNLILSFFEIGVVKFGQFTLKSGIVSPIYIDLRVLVSYPKILNQIAEELTSKIKDLFFTSEVAGGTPRKWSFDRLCGIPYTAIPIATLVSQKINKPMIYTRKEVKNYGTKRAIEGEYQKGEIILVLDDLITTGGSKFEAIEPIKKEGLIVKDIVVVLDREQGGKEQVEVKGYKLHSLLTMGELLDILHQAGKIDAKTYQEVKNFIKQTKIKPKSN